MQASTYRFVVVASSLCVCGFAQTTGKAAVSGRIVDYLARPVEGAEVAIYEEIRDFTTDQDTVRLRDEMVRTDANGWFVFPADIAPSYRVFIVGRKEGLALGWDVLVQPADNVIVLEKPCVLGGVVVDAAGRPVGGAKVRAVAKSGYLRRLEQSPVLGPEAWLIAKTDSHGSFRFENFAADVSADFWVEAPGRALVYTYTPHRLTVCGFEAGRRDIRLVLPEEVAVRGRVVDAESGDPVKDAHVVIHPDMIRHDHANPYLASATVSGEDGRFAFKGVPPGRHYINIGAPYDTGLVDRRVRFEAGPDQDAGESAANLDKGGVIEIEAREEQTNAPIPNLAVYFREAVQDGQSSFYKDAQTGPDGRLRIQAPAGLCKFTSRLDGYSPWSYEDQVFVTAGQTAKSQIVLRRYPKVSGLVVDEGGRPVGGAAVNHGVTDEAGRFEVPFPSEESSFGSSWIVRHTGQNLAAVVNVERDDKPIQIAVSRALTVSGRIVDPNGMGIPAARVALHLRTAEGLTPYGPEVLTDSQGRWEMAAVAPRRAEFEYRISADASGYGARRYQRISIEGEPGTPVELDPIVLLPANESVTGIVVDAEGNPMAGVPIAAGDGQAARYTVTDNDGRFVVRRVCKGPLRIQAGFSSVREEYGVLRAEGGDRDVKVVLGQDGVHPGTVSLVGKPLPDSKEFDLDPSRVDVEGKMIVLCFFDVQQRPSRNMMVELAKRAEQFNGRGVALLGIQASKGDRAQLDKWIGDHHISFPVRTIQADEEKIRRTWGIQSLPWLILADRARVVRAEGPQLTELEQQIEKISDKGSM